MRARSTPSVAPLLALAVALALFGSCSANKDDPSPGATLPPSSTKPSTTTTTPAADPFAIPKVIDEAYVNKVLAALDQIDGDALRSVVANRVVETDVPPMLRSIYNDPQFELELQSLTKVIGRGFDNFKMPPGNRKTLVARLLSASSRCVFLEAETSFSDVLKSEPPDDPDQVELFTLRPTQPGANRSGLNPTPWSVANAELIKKGDLPKERATCESD